VTAVACGCAALVLGAYALGVLARVSAHTHTHTHYSHQDLEQ
jgi:Ca2+/H+ antiporter